MCHRYYPFPQDVTPGLVACSEDCECECELSTASICVFADMRWWWDAPPPPPPPPDERQWLYVPASLITIYGIYRVWQIVQDWHEERRHSARQLALHVARAALAARESFNVDDLAECDGRNGGPLLIAVSGDGALAGSPLLRTCHDSCLTLNCCRACSV